MFAPTSRSRYLLLSLSWIVLNLFAFATASRGADWNVSIHASSNRQSSAQLEGNNSIREPGSQNNPWLICSDQSITVTWTAQVTGSVPASMAECEVSGPNWTWTGVVQGQNKTTVSKKFTNLSQGKHSFTETAETKYTYSPKDDAPPDHDCPQPATASVSKTVYVYVSAQGTQWQTYHSANLSWPPKPSDRAYDFIETRSPTIHGRIKVHKVGTIKVGRYSTARDWLTANCGQKLTSSNNTTLDWTTSASVSINLRNIASMSTGLSSSVSTSQTRSYSFGGTNGVRFRWKLEIPGWTYNDHRGNWERKEYDCGDDPDDTPWVPSGMANETEQLTTELLSSGGADFAKQWQCCG